MRTILQKYIQQLLVEGRVEDAKKRYPEVGKWIFNYLSEKDPSENNKYLMWMTREAVKKAPEEGPFKIVMETGLGQRIAETIQSFHEKRHQLKEKDIFQYSLEELETALKSIKPSKRQQKKRTKLEDATKIYEDENYLLLRPKNKEAVCLYGKSTKWCITQQDSTYEEYIREEIVFYFLIDKFGQNPYHPYHKIAIAYNSKGDTTIWDSEDNKIERSSVVDAVEVVLNMPHMTVEREEAEQFVSKIANLIEQDALIHVDDPEN